MGPELVRVQRGSAGCAVIAGWNFRKHCETQKSSMFSTIVLVGLPCLVLVLLLAACRAEGDC